MPNDFMGNMLAGQQFVNNAVPSYELQMKQQLLQKQQQDETDQVQMYNKLQVEKRNMLDLDMGADTGDAASPSGSSNALAPGTASAAPKRQPSLADVPVRNAAEMETLEKFKSAELKNFAERMSEPLKIAIKNKDMDTAKAIGDAFMQAGQRYGSPEFYESGKFIKNTKLEGDEMITPVDLTTKSGFATATSMLRQAGIDTSGISPEMGSVIIKSQMGPDGRPKILGFEHLPGKPTGSVPGSEFGKGKEALIFKSRFALAERDPVNEGLSKDELIAKVSDSIDDEKTAKSEYRSNITAANQALTPLKTAATQAARYYTASKEFEQKIQDLVPPTLQMIEGYKKSHPNMDGRAGGFVGSLFEGPLAKEAALTNVRTNLSELQFEVTKLASGSLGSAGVTAHSQKLIPQVDTEMGLDNVVDVLKNYQRNAAIITRANEKVKSDASTEYAQQRAALGVSDEDIKKGLNLGKPRSLRTPSADQGNDSSPAKFDGRPTDDKPEYHITIPDNLKAAGKFKGTPTPKEVAVELVKLTKGDKELAQMLARAAGWGQALGTGGK